MVNKSILKGRCRCVTVRVLLIHMNDLLSKRTWLYMQLNVMLSVIKSHLFPTHLRQSHISHLQLHMNAITAHTLINILMSERRLESLALKDAKKNK